MATAAGRPAGSGFLVLVVLEGLGLLVLLGGFLEVADPLADAAADLAAAGTCANPQVRAEIAVRLEALGFALPEPL